MADPGLAAIKTLFALSCNRCAFPGCDLRLTDPSWSGVRADIAHIRGENRGSARYAPDMTPEERNGVDNLLLLCPNHHREIDRLRPKDFSADDLMSIKFQHEAACDHRDWADDRELEHLASTLVGYSETVVESPSLLEIERDVARDLDETRRLLMAAIADVEQGRQVSSLQASTIVNALQFHSKLLAHDQIAKRFNDDLLGGARNNDRWMLEWMIARINARLAEIEGGPVGRETQRMIEMGSMAVTMAAQGTPAGGIIQLIAKPNNWPL
jgi:hypothetical protein